MTAIVTALRAGLERETLQRMVDAADSALRLTDEQRRQAEGPSPAQLPSAEAAAPLTEAAAGPSRGHSRAASAAEPGEEGEGPRSRDGESAGEDSGAAEARPNGGVGRISLRIKMKGGDASSSGAFLTPRALLEKTL